nr:hypothetical protein KUA23_15480 [Pseudomonas pergaminensis]
MHCTALQAQSRPIEAAPWRAANPIGILGVDKNGSEWYQVTLGGAQGNHSALGCTRGNRHEACGR